MKFKRGLAIALAASLAVAVLPGCSGSSSSSTPAKSTSAAQNAKQEDYTIEYLLPGAKDSKSMDNDIGKEIYKKFGIKINIVGYAGNWEEKCATMLAGGNYPDMLQLQGNAMVSKYEKAGALQDIGELAKQYAPNFLNFYKDSIPYWKLATDEHKLYNWTANTPDMEALTSPRFDMIVRSDILEQQGWPQVLDEDSYVKLLKTGLQQNQKTGGNDTLGCVIGASEDWIIGDAMQELYAHGKYPERSGVVAWDDDQKQFVDQVLDTASFKPGIKFWNRLYREKILDPECFTDTDAVAQQKLSSGRALSSFYVTWETNDVNKNLKNLGKGKMEYVTMPIMLKEQIDAGQKRVFPVTDSYDYQSVVITKNAKHPDRLMQLVNWVCTDEGQTLLGWGIKGKHYTVDAKGIKTPTKQYLDCANGTSSDTHFNDGISTNISYYFLGLSAGFDKNGQCYSVTKDESVQNAQMDNRLKEVYSHYGWKTVTDPWKINKSFGFKEVHTGIYGSVTLATGSHEAVEETKLKDFKSKQVTALILSKSDADFEANWNKFTQDYKSMNPDIVKKAYNDGYSKINAAFESVAK